MAGPETVLVVNPASGGGQATDEVRRRGSVRGHDVRETDAAGDGTRFAREAAEAGIERVVAAGGDGTLNEVVQGLADADALGEVTVGVVPAGTGNNFASNVGIESIADAFDVLDGGPVRDVDLGVDDGRTFVNNCVGGLTAEASERTTPERKERWGVLAYAITTLETLAEFQAPSMTVETHADDGDEEVWSGEAAFVFAGNARQFALHRVAQANMEDGLLDVAIVTGSPAGDLLEAATSGSLFGPDADYVQHRQTSGLDVSVRSDPVDFSFDGEMEQRDDLTLGVRPGALSVHVGEGYDPVPDGTNGQAD
jgi:YegS/Rv2252/BmrU family lipid kinase